MEAKNFRIGNLLRSKEWGGVGQIEGIELTKDGFEIKVKGYVHKCERGKYFDLRPIELTGKILEQLGFGKNEALYEFGDFALKEWTVGRQEQWQVFLGNSHLGQFNDMAIHELQNLFFALTGKELSIENVK